MIVKTDYLNMLPSGALVNLENLVKHKIVNKKEADELGVKILGNGKVGKKLTIAVPISKSAAKSVEKAGGKVLLEESKKKNKKSVK